MRFLVSAIGSAGDVHPFIAIAQALRARGHDVLMLASPPFEDRIRRAGIAFAPFGSADDYELILLRPELWDPRQGARLIIDEMLLRLPVAYATTAAQVGDEPTVLVGSTLSWGMRLVQEKTGLPGATVHLSPLCLLSATRPPVLPGIGDFGWMPAWILRLLQAAAERLVLDRMIAPRLNAFRGDLALPPVHRVWTRWMHSPDLVIGAWPDWFAPAQSDWPPSTTTSGFPLFTEETGTTDFTLDAFIAAGSPPIGITPGSAMAHGERFFAAALAACAALGRRALLVTPYRDQLPATLPAWAHHVAYAPFAALLPRLAALVHHGGIGTSAQALTAGIPQLVVPFAHDQFDNAARLARLGVSRTLALESPIGEWVDAFRDVLDREDVKQAVRMAAGRMATDEPAATAIARMLEQLGLGASTGPV